MLLHISSPTIEQVLAFHALHPKRPLNVLLSFAAQKVEFEEFQKLHRKNVCSLILDSGAYTLNKSAWAKRPKNILQAYANFCKRSSKYYDFLFNLDEDFSIHGFDANMYNQLDLEEDELTPISVAHNLDTKKGGEIDRLIKMNYDLIAIGQCQDGRPFSKLKPAVHTIYEGGKRNVHLFGVTELNILQELPIWSCDSSSWAKYVKFGQVMWWNDANADWNPWETIYFPKKQVEHDPSKGRNYWDYRFKDEFDQYINTNLNITIDDLIGGKKELYRGLVNIFFFKEMERRVTEYHRDVKKFVFPE
ncbi:hypothetical protein [Solidesulfovibrio sp.]